MCGTGTVGQTFTTPITSTATNTTQVAGDSGPGVAQGGGGSTDIAGLLAEITKSIESLKQALAGKTAVADATGGGPGGKDSKVAGAAGDAVAGAGGCGMSGCGGGGSTEQTGGSTEQTGGGDTTQTAAETAAQTGTQTGTQSDVNGDTGAGDKKDTAVDGTDGGGKVEQKAEETEVTKAQAALDAAKKTATEKADAAKAADAKVVSAKEGVTKAEDALDKANTDKVAADKSLADAKTALEAAKNQQGEHTARAGDTWTKVAGMYGIDVAELQRLNQGVVQSGSDAIPAGTKVVLPKGVGNHVTQAEHAVDAAQGKLDAAEKAVVDAIAALEAARAALKAAEDAAAAAKKAAEDAQKAVEAAQKALDDATKAAEDAAKKAAETTEQTDGVGSTTEAGGETAKTYTVAPGDTLSSIARRNGIANWRDLYELNKDVIGDNPNLILPGQVLKLPNGATADTGGNSTQQGGTNTGNQTGNQTGGTNNGGSNNNGGNTNTDGGGTTNTDNDTNTDNNTNPDPVPTQADLINRMVPSTRSSGTIASVTVNNSLGAHAGTYNFNPNDRPSFDSSGTMDVGGGQRVGFTLHGQRQPGANGTWKVEWTLSFPNTGTEPKRFSTTGVRRTDGAGSGTSSTQPSGVVPQSGFITYNGRKYVVGDFIGPITSDTTRLPGLQRGGRIYPAGFIGPIDSKSVRLPG